MNCHSIPKVNPIPINQYKSKYICVKRSKKTFSDIYQALLTQMTGPNLLEPHKISYTLDEDPVIDIKILNSVYITLDEVKELYGYDLKDYTKQQINQNQNYYYLYTKTLSSLYEHNNSSDTKFKGVDVSLHDFNKLIVDISLFNYVWCGYQDIKTYEVHDNYVYDCYIEMSQYTYNQNHKTF